MEQKHFSCKLHLNADIKLFLSNKQSTKMSGHAETTLLRLSHVCCARIQ